MTDPLTISPVDHTRATRFSRRCSHHTTSDVESDGGCGANPAELPPYLRWRRCVDRLLAGVLLVVCLPLLLLLLLVVRMSSSGPAVYRQCRIGFCGHPFTIYKLRTMRVDAEAHTGAVWSQPGDRRVTAVGRFLRWSHLDELLQLINVARGEMAFIGPRPERPEIIRSLANEMPGYLERLQVLPGVTGLSQVTLPPDSDLAGVRRKLVLDQLYIRNACLTLDLHILLSTFALALGLQRRMDTHTWQAFARECC